MSTGPHPGGRGWPSVSSVKSTGGLTLKDLRPIAHFFLPIAEGWNRSCMLALKGSLGQNFGIVCNGQGVNKGDENGSVELFQMKSKHYHSNYVSTFKIYKHCISNLI